MWSPEHVKVGLRLHKIASNDIINSNKFVILSSSNASDDPSSSTSSSSSSNNSSKKRRRFAVKRSGLSLEAFRLSDQAYRLLEKGNSIHHHHHHYYHHYRHY